MSQTTQSFKQRRRQIMLLMAAGLVGGMGIIWRQGMTKTTKQFKSVVELKQLAAREITHFEGGGPRLSFPVTTHRQGKPLIAFMIYHYGFRPGLVRMSPPYEVVWFNPASGELIAKTAVSPADFGQTHPANEPLPEWKFSMPPGMTTGSYAELHNHFFALYDVLFEVWATNPSTRSSALQSAAREFLKIFDQISEPPLRPYYDALGREYFEWVRALAK